MKIISFNADGRDSFGIVEGDQVADLGGVALDLKSAIAAGKLASFQDLAKGAPRLGLDTVTFLPTITNPDKIMCIGLNYGTHIRESGRDAPKFPSLFLRVANSQTGHDQPLIRPKVSQTFDYEGELAAVIGKPAHHVKAADALGYVAGYTCYNEGSIREWQRHSTQFCSGKNFYKSGSMGPWLVTTDDIPDPAALKLETRLNGEVMQSATTDDLVFGIAALVEYLSTITVLEPGDVIVSGTPGGVGTFRDPQVWMKPGDTIEVEISGIGVLKNSIVDES